MIWGSLFSGIGGFELALESTGHRVLWGCEIDEFARRVYQRRFPHIRLYEDATRLVPRNLPAVDGICAGFPCQPFSMAGERLGFEESRGTLFFEVARIAKEKRPRILLLENVVGLLSHDNGRTFAEILATLDEIGYDAEWQVLNSKHFGVPQNRARVFIVGHLRDEPTAEIFPLGSVRPLHDGTRPQAQRERSRVRGKLIGAIDAHYYKRGGAGSRTIIVVRVLGQPDRHRGLTPLECERAQGFPDGWTDGESDTKRYQMLGNAITVNVVKTITEALKI